MDRTKQNWRTVLLAFLLAAATLATFWPLVHAEFISFDDAEYVWDNPHLKGGLTWHNVKWALTTGYAANWHPLTWISHLADTQLFGKEPGGPHLVNLLLHTANGLLLFLLLQRMTGLPVRSAFVAGLFALHPLHVESVAWISERKDVLSGFFFMLTLLAYVRYAQAAEERAESREQRGATEQQEAAQSLGNFHPPSSIFYLLALLCFAFGLMSKPMLVTTPFVLLLLDYWPLGRVSREGGGSSELQPLAARQRHAGGAIFHLPPRLLVEKFPFFLLAALSSVVTLRVQSEAMANLETIPFLTRAGNASLATVTYLGQTFWPTHLAVFYPYPSDLPDAQVVASGFILLAITLAVLFLARGFPYMPVGWFWFLGMLVPVSGLVQVGAQTRADRYTYLPLIGIFVVVTWAGASVIEFVRNAKLGRRTSEPQPVVQNRNPKTPSSAKATEGRQDLSLKTQNSKLETQNPSSISPLLSCLFSCLLLGALAVVAHLQVRHWHNSRTLFDHARQVTDENYVAWGGLGLFELQHTNPVAAMAYLLPALEYARRHNAAGGINYNIGYALQKLGKGLEALPYLEVSEVSPRQKPDRDYRLALSLIEAGRLTEAETALKAALDVDPDNPEYQLGLAALLQSQGQSARAEQLFRKVLSGHPEMATAHQSFADLLLLSNRPAEAEGHFAAALRLGPDSARLRQAYAEALSGQGKAAQAIQQLQAALKLDPGNLKAGEALAELLSSKGSSREAVAQYEKVLLADPKRVSALNNLAWILATDLDDHVRNGPHAVELAERACQLTSWNEPYLVGTLAAAYAEAGRFPDAVAAARKARDTARASKMEPVAKKNEELLNLYESGKPFREQK